MQTAPTSARRAVTETATLQDARRAAGDGAGAERAAPAPGGPGSADPLLGDVRRAGLLPLLVLHLLGSAPSYGNQLMERICELSGGLLAVNPNTMYPLLRSLETRGLIEGSWEHPERRTRRFYRRTDEGARERDRLAAEMRDRLDRLVDAVALVRSELYGHEDR
jgi:PadR family transcriptional regulator, regulatory protein PadR